MFEILDRRGVVAKTVIHGASIVVALILHAFLFGIIPSALQGIGIVLIVCAVFMFRKRPMGKPNNTPVQESPGSSKV